MALPTVTLYQPPTRPWGSPNLSPFCAKLETYLRIAEIPHDVKSSNFPKAPKGKIPYVKLDDSYLGDSQLIIERLETLRSAPLDGWLTPEQRAVGHCVRRMLDEGFYFVVMYLRWNSEHTGTIQRAEFVKVLPKALRPMFPLIARSVRKALRSQGTGRHTPDEVMAMGRADIDALATLLGAKPFLLGDRPSTVDASLFAFVAGVLAFPGDSALKAHTAAQANLVGYVARLRAAYWPELG